MDGIGLELLYVIELVQCIINEEISEVILVFIFSVEGDIISLYLGWLFKFFCLVSWIVYGLLMGSELEYVDEVILSRVLEGCWLV